MVTARVGQFCAAAGAVADTSTEMAAIILMVGKVPPVRCEVDFQVRAS
jgi:hypothetical protein